MQELYNSCISYNRISSFRAISIISTFRLILYYLYYLFILLLFILFIIYIIYIIYIILIATCYIFSLILLATKGYNKQLNVTFRNEQNIFPMECDTN